MPWTQRDVDWVAARLLPDIYDINQRAKYDRNTKRLKALYDELTGAPVSAIDRIKAKALEARNVAGDALTSFEGELDSILAEKDKIARKITEAAAPHREIFQGIHGELEGLKSAIDLLSNGGPPLDPLGASAAASEHPIEHYHDPSYIEQVKK